MRSSDVLDHCSLKIEANRTVRCLERTVHTVRQLSGVLDRTSDGPPLDCWIIFKWPQLFIQTWIRVIQKPK